MEQNSDAFSRDGRTVLRSAVEEFARAEIRRIADAVIDNLRSWPSTDTFGDIVARHLWDEYCWSLQEGPFDENISSGDVYLGSMSGAFDHVVYAIIRSELDNLPKHSLVFLSMHGIGEYADSDVEITLASIQIDKITTLVINELNISASHRNLDLIGPHRSDVIGYEIEGAGMVWSILSESSEAIDLIVKHSDALLTPDGDLSDLADEMTEAFMAEAYVDDQGYVFSLFLEHFDSEVRTIVTHKDVIPSLEVMRASLLNRMDG